MTDRDEIFDRLQEIAAPHISRSRPGAETVLQLDHRLVEDLQLDSIARLALVVEIENRFEVVLEPEDEAQIERVGDLVEVVAEKLGPAG